LELDCGFFDPDGRTPCGAVGFKVPNFFG